MASRPPLHILVVDYDQDMVNVTTAVLEHIGYTTHGETESYKALRTFSDDPGQFDLAIIEPVMPKLMGLELAQRIRRIRRGFPVMFYSGYIGPSLSETIEAVRLGQTALRPLYMRELGEAVKGAVHSPPPDIN